ncbi:protein SCO1 homolog 2, mitochondrial [Impatiens glandulifera]|uniref:protein SCO1 homolog 2, mitochondrial n=1 Tax=Impatiens glandulifera TaxID=253017 RepID=UPI001FB115A8|nr:protein SCO1 homolog 2, mitochondrial [Impatiens glandulifera]
MSLLRFPISIRRRTAQALSQLKRFHTSNHVRNANSTKPRLLPEQTTSSTTASWNPFIVPAAVLGGIGGLVLLFHYNDERRAIPKGQGGKLERRNVEGPRIGGPFSLIDTEGRRVTEKDFLGKWVIFIFGYSSSPDVGPAELQKLTKAVQTLESKYNIKVLPVFVTIDPQRDTTSQLNAYLKEFDERIIGLTGPVHAIRSMAQEYRVYFKRVEEEDGDYLVESSHKMYLLNPRMEVTKCLGIEYNAEELADEILKEVNKS